MRIFLFLLALFTAFTQQVKAAPGSFNADKKSLQINDLYAFRSYETGRSGFVTIIANFGQDDTNIFADSFFDPNANYEIKIDSDGNGIENQTYRFTFTDAIREEVLTQVSNQEVASPFLSSGNIQVNSDNSFLNRNYEIELIRNQPSYKLRNRGPDIKNSGKKLRRAEDFLTDRQIFPMPENFTGTNSFTDYDFYSRAFIHNLDLRFNKCNETARVFVGQRQASRKENLVGISDNLNFDFVQAENGSTNINANKSVLSIALELPISCLDLPNVNPVIAVWANVHYPARSITRSKAELGNTNITTNRDFVSVARFAHPLVNEFLIGYTDQVRFTQKQPRSDENLFFNFFAYPVLAELIEQDADTSFTAPNNFPREDMVEFYLEGLESINQFVENNKTRKQRIFESIKLNTQTAPVAAASQNRLGVIGGDNAGYPNGRRPGDDVADIFLRVLMGNLVESAAVAPDKNTSFSDGVLTDAEDFSVTFPYLNAPQ